MRLRPYGLFGGSDAERTRTEVERDGRTITLRSKDRMDLRKGDILTLTTAGGGGYGPAAEREPRLVEHDVAEGYLSEAVARRVYGPPRR